MGERASPQRAQKKPQADTSSVATENRKLRNRLSQKAHRARQSIYIKELEKRLECASKPETALNAELEQRNMFFRSRLLDCQKKLESMQATMKSLSDSVSTALNMELSGELLESDEQREDSAPPTPPSSHDPVSSPEIDLPEHPFPSAIEEPNIINMDFLPTGDTETSSTQMIQACGGSNSLFMGQNDMFSNYSLQDNSIPTFASNGSGFSPKSTIHFPLNDPHMGPAAYQDLSLRGSLLLKGQDCQLRRTNSPFSDHIAVLEYFLKKKWEASGGLLNCQDAGLASSVSFMVSMFVTMSWPKMTAFYAHTKAHHAVVKLTTWRLNPTMKSYQTLGLAYMPTYTQLTVPHPNIIDWIPWPALRDKLIQHHVANPQLDDIVCEIGNSFVAEADLSELVAGIEPVGGYVGVWDLITVISPETTLKEEPISFQDSFGGWQNTFDLAPTPDVEEVMGGELGEAVSKLLPAPNVAALFNSRSYALQAFKKMNMDKGSLFFRLDPTFFERHPELYDSRADIMAHGIPLRPPTRSYLPGCKILDEATLGRYRECATWTFDLSFDGLIPTEATGLANSFS